FIHQIFGFFTWISGKEIPFFSNKSVKILKILDHWVLIQSQKIKFLGNLSLGVLFQFLAVYINYYVGLELGISVSLFDWFWIFGLISLALFLPITYAGLGIREGSMVGLLGIFSVDPEKAIALSFLILALQLTGVFVGFLWNFKKESK
ncbi:MAG: flippase-like domain-containing protein, partial [Leptospira sp.]|nr:flippase-like domain-containing protein [Leptospira sp.]